MLLALPAAAAGGRGHPLFIAIERAVKGLVVPWLLLRAIRNVAIRRESNRSSGSTSCCSAASAPAWPLVFSNDLPLALRPR
ncbi:MAG: hypothetical protein U1E73_09370 [Planctomycetota bacterium]